LESGIKLREERRERLLSTIRMEGRVMGEKGGESTMEMPLTISRCTREKKANKEWQRSKSKERETKILQLRKKGKLTFRKQIDEKRRQ